MIDRRKNILFLDMDGVLNSNYLVRKWCSNKLQQVQNETSSIDYFALGKMVEQEFKHEFCFNKELIFPDLAKRLNEIIETCNVKLIWSTTWRNISPYKENINNARAMLERRGINGSALMSYTPNLYTHTQKLNECRINEILSFIQNNSYGISFDDNLAAIDDLNLSALENNGIHFFQTEIEFGLTENIKEDILKFYRSSKQFITIC